MSDSMTITIVPESNNQKKFIGSCFDLKLIYSVLNLGKFIRYV
jgi:hypothetical protein